LVQVGVYIETDYWEVFILRLIKLIAYFCCWYCL